MSPARLRPRVRALAVTALAALAITGCSVGSVGGDSGGGGESAGATEITYLVGNDVTNTKFQQALVDGFMKANPDVKVTLETQPTGTEGDNLTKTKLSTGEMSDVFNYNDGSLLQALSPDTTLTPLDDQPWVKDLTPLFKTVVSTSKGLYGAPLGGTQAGAMLYNNKVYADLDLKVPTTWSEFMANNAKIKEAGKVTPIIQTYATDWTAQLFVLGDFANVAAQDPEWSTKYTEGKAKYVDQPALQGFANQQATFEAGYFNKNFASSTYDDGIKMLATGTGAHYPMLTSAVSAITANYPDNLDDVGVFPIPAQNAADTKLTVWMPNALYIPKTTEGAKADAAKKFIAWVNSTEGCDIQSKLSPPSGPYVISTCKLPSDVPAMVKDMQPYFDKENYSTALEFTSPIKGPALPAITVQVGSGISSATAGAKLYDEDVKKQAQQLNLPGW
jgi:raffinose/stachyose/melibiose transport system substrate-binding protein